MSNAARSHRDASGRLDFLIGLIALVAACLALVWVIPAQVEMPARTDQLSPRFFPTLSAIVIAVFGAAIMVRNWHWALRRVPNDGLRMVVETLAWAAWATVTMLLLIHVGFVVASSLSCFGAMLLAGQRRHLILCALGSVGLAYGLDLLAWHAFYIQLP
ncbi:tripartite tricarboxylate transporter TctB family protein [uncultured Maritimibacter sp.]|jgi:hypothetical protein|uniref:tripartite tricarboxylate transporter TctB family protein n=1 Tax=uncultured Maritimibacter sp. TaxID=991866 RepID=UPI0026140D64|nr:tripartite tricarboxylate transporter TctB family protein [uncultured Maritimibacter sp.]